VNGGSAMSTWRSKLTTFLTTFVSFSLTGVMILTATSVVGAKLPPADAFVTAGIWGLADPLERSARDASRGTPTTSA
jgi:hypothetical protein